MSGDSFTPSEPLDLFSRCFGCQYEFQSGDRRLRLTLSEFGDRVGLESFEGDDILSIGLCDDCTQPGEFKTPEIVP